MKKISFLLILLLAAPLYAQLPKQSRRPAVLPKVVPPHATQTQAQTNAINARAAQAQSQEQGYQPLLAGVSASTLTQKQNDILANTYRVEDTGGGYFTAFRLHKNWFLTCAHGLFQMMNEGYNHAVLNVNISVKERPDAPGATAPFALVIDKTYPTENANAKVFLFNPTLQLDSSNNGRGDDLALIYVPGTGAAEKTFKQVDKQFKQIEDQLAPLKEFIPGDILAGAKKNVAAEKKKANSAWTKFLNRPIKPFHLFILSEQTIIDELGYPGTTSYSFPLTAYYTHQPSSGVVKFKFVPMGTRKNTNLIFYQRVENLIPGTSGSPMSYGNYVVSVDSATNASPMLTEKFHNWLREKMGKDYTQGMCVKPVIPENAVVEPVYGENTHNWNDARPTNEQY